MAEAKALSGMHKHCAADKTGGFPARVQSHFGPGASLRPTVVSLAAHVAPRHPLHLLPHNPREAGLGGKEKREEDFPYHLSNEPHVINSSPSRGTLSTKKGVSVAPILASALFS